MAFGDELREPLGRCRDRIRRCNTQNVEAFATCVGGEFRFRGGGI
jgi:hypothetical protein